MTPAPSIESQLFAVYGASGAGRGVMPLLRAQVADVPFSECVFIDDQPQTGKINGARCLTFAQFRDAPAKSKAVAIAIANSTVREKLSAICSDVNITFVSVTAAEHVRMDEVEIGEGAIFSPFTTVTSNIHIGRHFHCNIGSIVEHDCRIGDFVTFAPGVRCNGNVHIADHAYIGAGAIIRQGTPEKPLKIGLGAIVGMGAVVLNDVPAGATVVGNPARVLDR